MSLRETVAAALAIYDGPDHSQRCDECHWGYEPSCIECAEHEYESPYSVVDLLRQRIEELETELRDEK